MLGALLAWEGGAGRGHLVSLKTIAEAVRDRFSFDAALCRLDYKDELAGLCEPVQGPWLPFSNEYRKSHGNPCRATWGEFMGDIGFRRPEILRESIGWWQGVMRECDISLVIADNAPCALMAARGLGIPSVSIGTGYLAPPSNMESFPILLPRYSTRIYDEAEIVDTINSVVSEFGVPKLEHLPEVYARQRPTRVHAGNARPVHRVAHAALAATDHGWNAGTGFRRRRDLHLFFDHREVRSSVDGGNRQPRGAGAGFHSRNRR